MRASVLTLIIAVFIPWVMQAEELVLRVRETVPAEGNALGQVEIEVSRENGEYAVSTRDISPKGVKGVQLPEVRVEMVRALCFHVDPEPEEREGRLIFKPAECGEQGQYALRYTLLSPDGTPFKKKSIPLTIRQPDLTLRKKVPTTSSPLELLPSLQLEISSPKLAAEVKDMSCILRLQLEVPVAVGPAAPLLLEVYKASALDSILFSVSSGCDSPAPYSIVWTCHKISEPGEVSVPLLSEPQDSPLHRDVEIHTDSQGFGHAYIVDARSYIATHLEPGELSLPLIGLNLIVTDEWGNEITTLHFVIDRNSPTGIEIR